MIGTETAGCRPIRAPPESTSVSIIPPHLLHVYSCRALMRHVVQVVKQQTDLLVFLSGRREASGVGIKPETVAVRSF